MAKSNKNKKAIRDNARRGKAKPKGTPYKVKRVIHTRNVKRKPAKVSRLTHPKTKLKPVAKAKQAEPMAKLTTAKLKEKEANTRKRTNVSIPQPEEAKLAIERLLKNERAAEYLKKNVSKMAVDVVDMLVTPKTDEFLAEQLGMKINAIRRILNIMQGYGITNYYISKNTKGWLSFAWYINTSKLSPFLEYIDGMEREKSIISEKCNDYFMCANCYKTDKFLFTFDSAFENSFKCSNCGKNLDRKDKTEVEALMSQSSTKS